MIVNRYLTNDCFLKNKRGQPPVTLPISRASLLPHYITGEVDSHNIEALKSIAAKADINIPDMINALFNKPICQKNVVEKTPLKKKY